MLDLSNEFSNSLSTGLDGDSLFEKRAPEADATVDMTAMIDLVFMLNIFFLVTSIVASLAEIDLPSARHVVAADLDSSVVFTVLVDRPGRPPRVFVGDGEEGQPLPAETLDQAIAAATEAGRAAGKTTIIIKAEKAVRMHDVARISAAATANEEMPLTLAVMEKD